MKRSLAKQFTQLIVGPFLGTLFCGLLWLPAAQANPIKLGVVRSADNSANWSDIEARLQAAQVPYQVIDWHQSSQNADLQGVTVLLLPNVETLSEPQLLSLQAWMGKGGKVIATGPVGNLSSLGVQQALRSLLGAYWDVSLSQPAALQVLKTSDAQAWLKQVQPASNLQGGRLIPTKVISQTVATWQGIASSEVPTSVGSFPVPASLGEQSINPAAVITTGQSTFLGWQWGRSPAGSAEFDSRWLRAALSQYGSIAPPEVAKEAPKPETVPSLLASSPQAASSPMIAQSSVSPQTVASTNAALQPDASVSPTPAASPTPTSPAPQSNAQSATASPATTEFDIDNLIRLAVPKHQPVVVSSRPIDHKEARQMLQDLAQLTGRIESTLLSVQAMNVPIRLEKTFSQATTPYAVADASGGVSDLTHQDSRTPTPIWDQKSNETIDQARQFLQTFPDLVAQRDYANARRQWLQIQRDLLQLYPVDQPLIQPEIRAIWLDRGTIVRAGSKQGLAKIFDQMASAGINTVFLETVNAGYPIYPSQIAPQQNPQIKDWDPLEAAIQLAHERGMHLHAWVWVFAAGNARHNQLLGLPEDYPGPVLSAHPDWANYDNRGRMAPVNQPKPFLDPANPEVRQYLLKLFTEIVTYYDVDGLQLDYIRYPFQLPAENLTYGYGKASREQFQALTGVDPLSLSATEPSPTAPVSSADPALWSEFQKLTGIDPMVLQPPGKGRSQRGKKPLANRLPDNDKLWKDWVEFRKRRNDQLWKQWTEFRVGQVDSFVAEASRTLRQAKPDVVLSAAVFPIPEWARLHRIQQHWEVWVRRGDLDLLVPMTYASDTSQFQSLTEPLLKLGNPRSTIVLPGIRLLNLPEAIAVDQIQALRDAPFEGYALFAAENLNNRYHALFNQTQGILAHCTLQKIPCQTTASLTPQIWKPDPPSYQQPFQAAHSRYLGLKREWSLLLAYNQLPISDSNLKELRSQATIVDHALRQLSANPSMSNLIEASSKLEAFRQKLPTWFHAYGQQQPYQLQAWENRLLTIETLVRYGERRLRSGF